VWSAPGEDADRSGSADEDRDAGDPAGPVQRVQVLVLPNDHESGEAPLGVGKLAVRKVMLAPGGSSTARSFNVFGVRLGSPESVWVPD
jgi:hypothetical protein